MYILTTTYNKYNTVKLPNRLTWARKTELNDNNGYVKNATTYCSSHHDCPPLGKMTGRPRAGYECHSSN